MAILGLWMGGSLRRFHLSFMGKKLNVTFESWKTLSQAKLFAALNFRTKNISMLMPTPKGKVSGKVENRYLSIEFFDDAELKMFCRSLLKKFDDSKIQFYTEDWEEL